MPSITIRFLNDDQEIDWLDSDLPSDDDASEFIAECKGQAETCAEAFHPDEVARQTEALARTAQMLKERFPRGRDDDTSS